MAEKEKKTAKTEDSIETKVESSVPQKTVSGISGTKTLRVGRVNKKAKKPPVEEGAAAPAEKEAAPVKEPEAVKENREGSGEEGCAEGREGREGSCSGKGS